MMSILWISLFYCIVAFTKACEPDQGFQSRSIEDRADDASTVIIGEIVSTHEGSGGGPCWSDSECGYWANVTVECVIRDNSSTITLGSKSIKVVGFGSNSDCTSTDVRPDNKYILLMEIYPGNMYELNEVNGESAADRVSTRNLETYVSLFPGTICRQPTTTPPTTTPPTTTIPTKRQARTSTSADLFSTTMNGLTTKLKNKNSNQDEGKGKLETKPTAKAINASSKISISFLAFTTMLFTLLVAI